MIKLQEPSSTRNMMIGLAAGAPPPKAPVESSLGRATVCIDSVTRFLIKPADEMQHMQITVVMPAVGQASAAYGYLSNDFSKMLEITKFKTTMENTQSRAETLNTRIQQSIGASKGILADVNEHIRSKNEVTEAFQSQLNERIKTIQPILNDAKKSQPLIVQDSNTITQQINPLLPREQRAQTTTIQLDSTQPRLT